MKSRGGRVAGWAICLGCVCVWAAGAAEMTVPSVVPAPSRLAAASGCFVLTERSSVRYDASAPGARDAAVFLASWLRPATGFDLRVRTTGAGLGWLTGASASDIRLAVPAKGGALPPEGYTLEAGDQGVVIAASDAAGFFYGAQTLRQLFPNAIFGNARESNTVWRVSGVSIEDAPRFAWRGMMLDEGRHFFGKAYVLRQLDLMAEHKLNVFHWHLTDDQGWRIEIKAYPRLTTVGAVRPSSVLPGNRNAQDGKPYGPYFYTQEEIREIVAYARARHIRVVPEIEMPGHARAALAAYPELSCRGVPLQPRVMWGVEDEVYCAGHDETLRFEKAVLDEVCALFDSPFIHVGGDECPKTRWKACPKCQARMKKEGLKDEHELQSWFVRQIDAYLTQKGRRLIGWDEILEGGLAPGAAVMSWRGVKGGQAAAESGHDVVMAPTTCCYLDYRQVARDDGYEYIGGLLPMEKVYAFDPCDGISAAQSKHVLGGQGNLWSEYVWGQKDADWKLFPRLCAMSEVLWSPQAGRAYDAFLARLAVHADRLKRQGVNIGPISE